MSKGRFYRLNYRIDKVITYNEKEPDRRIVYKRINTRKK